MYNNNNNNLNDDIPWFIRIPCIIIGLAFIWASLIFVKWAGDSPAHPFLDFGTWLLLFSVGTAIIFTSLGIKPP
jgi:hypothetical protein